MTLDNKGETTVRSGSSRSQDHWFVEYEETLQCIQALVEPENDTLPVESERTLVGALHETDSHVLADETAKTSPLDGTVDSYSTEQRHRRHESPKTRALERLQTIFNKYLECPTLLDPVLEELIQRLCALVQQASPCDSIISSIHVQTASNIPPHDSSPTNNTNNNDHDDHHHHPLPDHVLRHVQYPLSALYTLSKVRGRKIVSRFLPHNVDDFDTVWKWLQIMIVVQQRQHQQALSSQSLDTTEDHPPLWESLYMLWNWMGGLSLVPFDFHVIANDSQQIVKLIKSHAQTAMNEAGPVREAAAHCWALWLCRPDLEAIEIPDFVQWTKDTIITVYCTKRSNRLLFPLLGVLQTITTVLKKSTMPREKLVPLLLPLWTCLLELSDVVGDSNLLLRKLLVKWWTRMSCAFLPPRLAPWRYRRGKRSLLDNVQKTDRSVTTDTSDYKKDPTDDSEMDENALGDLFLVPDEVEDGMGRLIEALAHSSTLVRWSAAKGVGRITERLPAICAEDVLDSLLEYFEDVEKDNHWHGACLALAELARRGLLLPNRLSHVVPQVVAAVLYDVQRGHKSVGANVRDAACYTYWAFARAYSPSVMKPYMRQLSEAIILTSLFDREVNCRRAASAAFQEAVGRQGATNFPHGIDILTAADYFSLGNRRDAYTSIARHVASFEEYRVAIFDHLYRKQLAHWDPDIRELTSLSLRTLTDLDPSFVRNSVLPYLMSKSLDPRNLNLRHGSVLGVAEIVFALSECDQLIGFLSKESMAELIGLVPSIEKKRLYRGRGGEIMRSAVCRLIECTAISRVPLETRDQVRLLDTVDSCIPHPSEAIQRSACSALEKLMASYFPVSSKGPTDRLQKRVVDKFVHIVNTSDNPGATRGYTLALGHLPAKLLAPNSAVLCSVILCLQKASHYDALVGGESDAETRRNAVSSLERVASTISAGVRCVSEFPVVSLESKSFHLILDTFLLALEDYKSDRRGDVGSWSRMAAMGGLATLAQLSGQGTEHMGHRIDESKTALIVGRLLKQLAEPMDSVRQQAGLCLKRILCASGVDNLNIPHRNELIDLLGFEIESDCRGAWSEPTVAFPRALEAATVGEDAYFVNVVAGMTLSTGSRLEAVRKSAESSLLRWFTDAKDTEFPEKLGWELLSLLQTRSLVGRFVLCTIKTLKVLLANRCLDTVLADLSFAAGLVEALHASELSCGDVHRLIGIVDVLVSLIDAPNAVRVHGEALSFLCSFLVHRFPRVRSYAAEQIYVVLLEHSSLINEHSEEAVLETLLRTAWTADIQLARKETDYIVSGLSIPCDDKAISAGPR